MGVVFYFILYFGERFRIYDLRVHVVNDFIAVGIYSRVFLVPQNAVYGVECEAFAFIKNPFFGQAVNDLPYRITKQKFMVYVSYNSGSLFVYYDLFVFYLVAERMLPPWKFPLIRVSRMPLLTF